MRTHVQLNYQSQSF